MRALQIGQVADGVAAVSWYDARMILSPPDHEAIAIEALAAMDGARQIAPFSVRYPGLSLDDAYRISARLCALRTARGERVIGRKIGFTNRTIWAEYGVYAPMWGFVFDTTVRDLPPPRQAAQHPFTLARFAEPPRPPPTWTRRRCSAASTGWHRASRSCTRFFRAGSSRPPTPSSSMV